jgi:hypothetical protein
MDENPYKSPESVPSEPAKARPKSRVLYLTRASLTGAFAGAILFGAFMLRGPADPWGYPYDQGACYGGLIGLAIAVYRIASRRDGQPKK